MFAYNVKLQWDTCGREARTGTYFSVVKGKRIPVDGALKRKKRVLFIIIIIIIIIIINNKNKNNNNNLHTGSSLHKE